MLFINIESNASHEHEADKRLLEAINVAEKHQIKLEKLSYSYNMSQIKDKSYELSLDFDYRIIVECSRCLGEFCYPGSHSLTRILTSNPEERDSTKRDLNIIVYDSHKINLWEIIREEILLALPIKLLCDNKCKGLCPSCGINLNQEKCNCSRKATNNPFSALNNLI